MMSPHTLSAVIEKHIRQLCLTDFPCGRGSLRKTVDGAVETETEETDSLLDLLICPHSPWWHDASWSPQALTLRKLAVLSPERLHTDFIHKYFTTLRIVDEDVSVVDGGLLKFSKLEELVLSANRISEIPADNLPCTLKVLELRANRLSALNSLTSCTPPHLWYLGLGSNRLGSCQDTADLSGRHWPQLVCLDLGDCEFEDQRALLSALTTLPCLKTLVLEGNPFTLALSYPGLTVDTLPQLSCLDDSWIAPEERHRFKGLAKLSDVTVDQASVTVRVGRVKGIPDPLMSVDENAPDFPVVTYSYFITYEFLTDQTPVDLKVASESKCDTEHVTEDDSSDADPQLDKNCEREKSAPDTGELNPEEACCDIAPVSRHSTSKLTWSEHMDFSDTHVHTGRDLGGLKKFLNRGLYLRVEEEKVLSWPAASEDVAVAKPGRPVKEKKGGKERESPIKSGSTKDKSKDKKRKSVSELVQDAPVRRSLVSVHVPLQSLVRGDRKVDVLCDLGALHAESVVEATPTCEKDLEKKLKEENKKEDNDSKRRGGSGTAQKNTASSKGKGKAGREREADVVPACSSVCVRLQPATVALSVELEKWESESEARGLLHTKQNPKSAGTGGLN
ncbi:leucine-rich repeat-containing protein 43 [Hippoglossus stenolepis]|uniref:leucine-rich repeat-containing protein 43 n=1 Tax=Hippoglossus stenolepis TaxID=195615 RepID=UPI001FAE9375|nr:leucine-rich repeat-containing protein 43 [Hippoglossus stenolepis]